ncbi:hypothetical protein C7120_03785 [Prevotella sp. oral taxon 376]|nr:hypothetical protein C7120_03785 [Prevotella sp. oral taxon 376]
MQIISFPAHYQSVYTNFDISSFSLISCHRKGRWQLDKIGEIVGRNRRFCASISPISSAL